jgi:acyl-CoA thioesterase
MTVSDAVLRRKLYQASTDHTARYVRVFRSYGDGWLLAGCRCGWSGSALHEHQMDEMVKAVRAAYAGPTLGQ